MNRRYLESSEARLMMAMIAILYFSIGVTIVLYSIHRYSGRSRKAQSQEKTVYKDISPYNGDWKTQSPIKIRNFKDVYHLTMGLQSCSMNDLVLMDNSYKAKIDLRRALIQDHHDDVIGFNPVARDAVLELYHWLFIDYLPRRFPSAFRILEASQSKTGARAVQNLVTNEIVAVDPPMNAQACLATIGRHIDCEFAILLPTSDGQSKPARAEPTSSAETIYHLHAFVLVFPSGFNTAQKLGISLADIHGPVPGYSSKLEKSMNRYFANLPFGKVVQRSNWAISTDGVLFKLKDMHTDIRTTETKTRTSHGVAPHEKKPVVSMASAHYEPSAEDILKWQEASRLVDPAKCSLRMERQTLHRLEKTGALVFAFKTFLEPLCEIKEEGLGLRLAEALRGLSRGSVPAMDVYKDGVIWRDPLVEYLVS